MNCSQIIHQSYVNYETINSTLLILCLYVATIDCSKMEQTVYRSHNKKSTNKISSNLINFKPYSQQIPIFQEANSPIRTESWQPSECKKNFQMRHLDRLLISNQNDADTKDETLL